MPELPEVEVARITLEQIALHRKIVGVDDTDRRECRPHPAGEIHDALVGRTVTGVFRRGKTMWCETSGIGRSRTAGRVLGLHLGMTGQIVGADGSGTLIGGGDQLVGRYRNSADYLVQRPQWNRFTITFAGQWTLRLFDINRLGRVWLDPDLDAIGPDAEHITLKEFRDRVSAGRAAVKSRLLDQTVVSGIGNLLADETLWQARVDPRRAVNKLSQDQMGTVHAAMQRVVTKAIQHGGAYSGELIPFRFKGAHCPRCDAPMEHGVVGGRSTWWCPKEQT